MFRELVAAVWDAWACGDWVAHLVSWWRVVTGLVRPGDRVGLTPAASTYCAPDDSDV
jgi:hypothetical protein